MRTPETMLAYEAKRSPELADMINRVNQISEEEIKTAKFLPWIRIALLEMKNTVRVADLFEDLEKYITFSFSPDPMGEMRRWVWSPTYIKTDRSSLEIRDRQLIWIEQKGVWIDTLFSKVIDPLLLTRTEVCGRFSRTEYMNATKNERNSMTTGNAPVTVVAEVEKPMFTFFRPG